MRITNVHGDVSRGKLGDSAFQLKDGKQMRRLVSKKGGITSKTQNKQRSLFRRGLTWRKELSHEDRQSLESIAYQNNIRNQDGVILDWSMLAMRIFMSSPTFTWKEV